MFDFLKNKTVKILSDSQMTEILQDYWLSDEENLAKYVTTYQQYGQILTINLRLPANFDPEIIHQQLSKRLHLFGIKEVNMNVNVVAENSSTHAKPLPQTTNAVNSSETITKKAPSQQDLQPHPRICHIVLVASGKGGVGKSTTTANLAFALQRLGKRVGVLDADIYGPSMPTMLGVTGIQPLLENEQFVPIDVKGMPMLSIGSLLSGDNVPVAWRGAKATGALMQLYQQTNWPNLDYLLIDMPPGTGDIQLTLAQRIPVTAAVIVTTPQHIALLDAQKGIEMFAKTQIPVLGIVENMALHICSACGHTENIFGTGGGEKMATLYGVPLLGQLPLAKAIREQADSGQPSVLVNDDYAKFYLDIAERIEQEIGQYAKVKQTQRIF